MSAAARPAAPPPTITTEAGAADSRQTRRRRWRRQLLANEHALALTLHAPARDRIQRRSAQRLAGAQAETRVMQRTPDGVADDQPFGERAAIVRAVRADGEPLVARAREQHLVVADPSRQHAAVGDGARRERLARGQVLLARTLRS